MTDRIILVCIAVFMPLAIVVINKLIDRTAVKEKDSTIADLASKLSSMTAESVVSSKSEKIAKQTSKQTSELAQDQLNNAQDYSTMTERAKNIKKLEDALELARQQVENTK